MYVVIINFNINFYYTLCILALIITIFFTKKCLFLLVGTKKGYIFATDFAYK